MRSFSNSCLRQGKPSALAERFEQILSEKIDASNKSVIDAEPTLHELYSKYHHDARDASSFKDAQFQDKTQLETFKKAFQKEIGYVASEHYLKTKEDRVIADHWDGTEKVQETALRMILDSAPKAKKIKRGRTLFTPPKAYGVRVTDAKEGSLDYKISKSLNTAEKEKEEFREMYKERLLGPAMFIDHTSTSSILGTIGNMASARINAAIDRKTGKFESPNMDKVRGKPLDTERLVNATDSNYFMNQILKNQECLPVWIENQQGIDRDITSFRHELKRKLFKAVMEVLTIKDEDKDAKTCLEYFRQSDPTQLQKAANSRLLERDSKYLKAKIEDLNRGVRNYNLQCPSTGLHKWKVVEGSELDRQFHEICANFESLISEHITYIENLKLALPVSAERYSIRYQKRWSSSEKDKQGKEKTPGPHKNGLWRLLRRLFGD